VKKDTRAARKKITTTEKAPAVDDMWRIPDELWNRLNHCCLPANRIRLVVTNHLCATLSNGRDIFCSAHRMPVECLERHRICHSSSAHRGSAMIQAGFFCNYGKRGCCSMMSCKALIDMAVHDGAMTKPRWAGKKTGPNPTDRAKEGVKRSLLCEGGGIPIGIAVDGLIVTT